MLLFSILLVVLVTLMHGMSTEIHRIIGRFKRKSIVEIIRLKDGLDSRIMGLKCLEIGYCNFLSSSGR